MLNRTVPIGHHENINQLKREQEVSITRVMASPSAYWEPAKTVMSKLLR